MAKLEGKCPVKYCRNDKATCEKHAGGGYLETLSRARLEKDRATATSRSGCQQQWACR